jgi:hypothetical protein
MQHRISREQSVFSSSRGNLVGIQRASLSIEIVKRALHNLRQDDIVFVQRQECLLSLIKFASRPGDTAQEV